MPEDFSTANCCGVSKGQLDGCLRQRSAEAGEGHPGIPSFSSTQATLQGAHSYWVQKVDTDCAANLQVLIRTGSIV
jgi:hypothetical protein